MVQKGKNILLFICIGFLMLTIGVFVGRNSSKERITIPDSNEIISETPTIQAEELQLDINEMSKAQLIALPGIGETLADRIIAYRDQYGPFQSMDDLLNVEGIGEGKLEQIANLVKVGG